MTFAWDNNKNTHNIKKHGLPFTDARTAFYDPDNVLLYDEIHSAIEDQYILIGRLDTNIFVVSFTVAAHNKYSIISARKAEKSETRVYYNHQRSL